MPGRIDIFLIDPATKSALVVELKYVRIGFLLSTQGRFNSEAEKHKKWKEENEKIAGLPTKEKAEVLVRHYYNNKKDPKLVSVHSMMQEAANQAVGYCNSLREGGLRRLDADTRLFRVVILGIGKSVINHVVREYIS
jgi:hypothetical protein